MKDAKKQEASTKTGAASVYARKRALALKRARRRRITLTVVVLALVAAAVCVLVYLHPWDADATSRRSPNADLGPLEGKTPEEIQEELNRVVDEGMFDISIAQTMVFPAGDAEGEVRIENVPGNRYLMEVTISLDDTGEVVYESGIIEPNHHITKDKLKTDLDAGNYAATATFSALDPETEDVVGTAAAKVTIMVEN